MKGSLLDTNVISELYRGDKCSPGVRAWYNRSGDRELFISVLTVGEIRRGIELCRLKDFRKAASLEKSLLEIETEFQDQILPITTEIADLWGRLSPRAPMPVIDGLLAATALHHRLTLVTRNKAAVARSGARCFNPFTD